MRISLLTSVSNMTNTALVFGDKASDFFYIFYTKASKNFINKQLWEKYLQPSKIIKMEAFISNQ